MAIRVMVVDDSNFMRKAISTLISSDHRIEVVSLLGSGEEALKSIPTVAPDVITLDWELPGMNGLDTLNRIMESAPTPVVMFSAYTKKGADLTLRALEAGAIDFIEKPSGAISLDLGKVQGDLIGKIVTAASAGKRLRNKGTEARPLAVPRREVETVKSPEKSILFIASSTGGVQALNRVVPFLPAGYPMPVLIVQHMPPLFTKSLSQSLDAMSKLSVKEAADGDTLTPGNVYIAPGGWQTKVFKYGKEMKIRLDKGPEEVTLKPSADISMASIAENYGSDAVAVILTGMGDDGTKGAGLIKGKGGMVFAQDKETSTLFGMPRAVIDAGLADAVLPLDGVAGHLVALVE